MHALRTMDSEAGNSRPSPPQAPEEAQGEPSAADIATASLSGEIRHAVAQNEALQAQIIQQAKDLGARDELLAERERRIQEMSNRITALEMELDAAKEASDRAWKRRDQMTATLAKQIGRVDELARTETYLSNTIAQLRAEIADAQRALT